MKSKFRRAIVITAVSAVTLFVLYQGFVLLYVFVPWSVPWVGDILITSPPAQAVKYGEFPFKLTYEIGDSQYVAEDTIICKFSGFETRGTAGRYRNWEEYLKSGKERITLLDCRDTEFMDRWGNRILEFYFDYGNAQYYMGDEVGSNKGGISNSIPYMYQKADGSIGFSAISAEEAYETYQIKLINWEVSPPIQNSFQ